MFCTRLTSLSAPDCSVVQQVELNVGDVVEVYSRDEAFEDAGPGLVTVTGSTGQFSFRALFCGAKEKDFREILKASCRVKQLRFLGEDDGIDGGFLDILTWKRVCGAGSLDLSSLTWLDEKNRKRVSKEISQAKLVESTVVNAALNTLSLFPLIGGLVWCGVPVVGVPPDPVLKRESCILLVSLCWRGDHYARSKHYCCGVCVLCFCCCSCSPFVLFVLLFYV